MSQTGPVRALSLIQPWATLVAIGAKRYETRSWATSYRGPLAIAASSGFPRSCRDIATKAPFWETLAAAEYSSVTDLPTGQILAVVELVGCMRVHWDVPPCWHTLQGAEPPGEHEKEFGDYTAGRYAWALSNVRRLPEPVPAKGMLGVWRMPEDVARAVAAGLEALR